MFSSIITLALLSTSVLAGISDCSRTYTVQSGDWCDTISASQNSSTYQLAYNNQGTINACCSNLQINQTICLAPKSGPDCTSVHVVAGTDTCDSIAATYATNMTMIQANNPQLDSQCTIYTGQVLCVAGSLMALAPVTTSNWVVPHPCEDDSAVSTTLLAATPAPATVAAAVATSYVAATIPASTSVTGTAAPTVAAGLTGGSDNAEAAPATLSVASTSSTDAEDECDDDEEEDDSTSTSTTSAAGATSTSDDTDDEDVEDCDDN
ncbi:hypothetical protein FRB97_005613 [Tulasnella sp. 331]|nr:hypothetical protein FRB97_005613 [Tulasnella sp. 331]